MPSTGSYVKVLEKSYVGMMIVSIEVSILQILSLFRGLAIGMGLFRGIAN
jgi:hypothetical protein